ncbi:rhomboid family intramembrane serine protease [Bifidobacterium canis]|uniref:Rhomboid family intramembrane serine protease n=1 Tax=Bifidobacterium canis TaxID=2610880 RepID=A0A7K1J459_9BIFI|nr:rhomboid family intramembrane serine protease [Bifidobacterium canis]MUH59319.1 rhomboid family intramembrane serine protease [Bifidobacterium canis]
MPRRGFSLFPDSPSARQIFSATSLRARWRSGAPVITSALIIACVAIWIIETLFRFVWPAGLTAMLNFGMMQPASMTREPWTLITAMFLHQPVSIWHIGFNMLTLWSVGPLLERMMGHWAFLILYMISGIGGDSGMMIWALLNRSGEGWFTSSYGASGALFGLFAAILVIYKKVGEDIRSMLIWMAVNFLMPLVVPNIAWQAHVGGFIIGGVMTLLLTDGIRALRRKSIVQRALIYGGALLVILLVICYLCDTQNPIRGTLLQMLF